MRCEAGDLILSNILSDKRIGLVISSNNKFFYLKWFTGQNAKLSSIKFLIPLNHWKIYRVKSNE